MKRTRILYKLIILIGCLISANYASAQEERVVKIDNATNETRKICMYNADDSAALTPFECIPLTKGETKYWDRGTDRSNFQVKVFIWDTYSYTRPLFGSTEVITMFEGERFYAGSFGKKDDDSPGAKYVLRVCNRQYDEKIYFTLGFETDKAFAAHGWWNVSGGKCVDIAVSEMLKNDWGLAYGNLPETFYHAKIKGDHAPEWKGGENDYGLCVNENKFFRKLQFQFDTNEKFKPLECIADGEKPIRFLRLTDPKIDQNLYYLTF